MCGKKILADRKKTLAYISKKVPLKIFCLPDHIKRRLRRMMSNAGNFMTGVIYYWWGPNYKWMK